MKSPKQKKTVTLNLAVKLVPFQDLVNYQGFEFNLSSISQSGQEDEGSRL